MHTYSILNGNLLILVNVKLEQMTKGLRGLSSSNWSVNVYLWGSYVQEPEMWETRAPWDHLLGRSMGVLHVMWIYILPADSNLDHLESKNRIRPPMLFVFVECYVFMRVLLSHCSLPVIIHVASQVCKFFMHSYVSVGNTWLTLHCRN